MWYSQVPVSEPEDPERDETRDPGGLEGTAPVDPEGASREREPGPRPDPVADAEPELELEPDDDLDRLEAEGFDEIVAEARAAAEPLPSETPATETPDDDPPLLTRAEAGLSRRLGWGRSPIVAVIVLIVGAFLLAATWGDFRYFLRSLEGEPRDLGTVADIYENGEFNERLHNQWVVLEGDPDVQHAARMQTRDGWVGFMRLLGADASLFVSVPRATQEVSNRFPGRFEGRIQRLESTPQWDKLVEFFRAEELFEVVDVRPESLVAGLASGLAELSSADGEPLAIDGGGTLRLVVRLPVGQALLGRDTWPTQAEAEAAVAALGLPWAFVEGRATDWAFVVYVGDAVPVERFQALSRALNGGEDLSSPDPRIGGLVLPRRATYLVSVTGLSNPDELELAEGQLSFPYGVNTAETGWRRTGERLVRKQLVDGRLAVPVAALEGVRFERALALDPDGYLLISDQAPRDVWPSALMFGAVLGVMLLNGWALLATLRRRRKSVAAR